MCNFVLVGNPNMTFSKVTINAAKGAGFTWTKKRKFVKHPEYVVINHGGTGEISFGTKVKKATVINLPTNINLSSNKRRMMEQVQTVKNDLEIVKIPETSMDFNDMMMPFIEKPLVGYGGKGVVLHVRKPETRTPNTIYQEFIPDVDREYRFVFFNKELVNISRKMPIPGKADFGHFEWRSIGMGTKLPKSLLSDAERIVEAFDGIPSLAVDFLSRETEDGREFYFGEVNSAYGLGEFTANRLMPVVKKHYSEGKLDKYITV